jgi:hypothetical protein
VVPQGHCSPGHCNKRSASRPSFNLLIKTFTNAEKSQRPTIQPTVTFIIAILQNTRRAFYIPRSKLLHIARTYLQQLPRYLIANMDTSTQSPESSSSSQPLIDKISSNEPVPYTFPTDRLRLTLNDPTKTPLCVVACGSFSPVTYMHLRMFEMAMDHSPQKNFEIVGGYLSPVGDAYKKRGLASAKHR